MPDPTEYTITFAVGTTITVSPKTITGAQNDEINFSTNSKVYVTFASGEWPFDEDEGTITVEPTTGAGPYTLRAKSGTKINEDSYTVSTEMNKTSPAGIQTSGEIDID